MGLASKVAVGFGAKTLVNAVGGAISGAYGVVSKTGRAIGEAGKALGSTAQNTKQSDTPSNNVVIANTGMAGSAGKQKVTGGGTLPAAKAVAKPQVSTKMPTEELLNTAVKYLSSIDRSLKAQLDFEKNSYQEQARAEREAIIENKPSTTFSDMKDRLSGLKSDTKDNVSMAGTILKYAAILGGAAALIASALGEKELNALKENIDEFKKKFSWLGDMASFIGIGGLAGFIFGGKGGRLKGGLVGIVASHVIDRMYSLFTGGYKKDENGNVLIDQNGEPIKESRSMSAAGYGLSLAAGGIAARGIAKRLPAAKLAGQTAGQLGRAAGSSSIAGVQAATKKGTSWLATRRGRKFLIILGRKLGKGVVAKLGLYLARIVAGLLATATGIGAIPGILMILGSIAFIGFDIFDIATSIYDAFKESGADDATATAVPAGTKEQDATKVAGTAAGSNTQTQIPVSNQAILATIRTKESGNDYGAQNPVSTASGAYQFVDGTWQALSKKYGIGTEYSKAKFAPPQIQDAVADKYVSEILQQAGGDVSKVPVAWYTGNIRGSSSAASSEQVAAYQADWLRVYNGGNPDSKAATNSSYNSSTPSISGMVNSGAEQVGKIFGMLGSSIIKPGIARNITPSGSNVSEQISNESMKLQNDITFGIKKEKSKDKITSPTIPAGTPRGVRPAKSVSYIDPNYQNINVLHKYLAHFRMAS